MDLKRSKVKLPKLKWVMIRGYRNLKSICGKIINATISKEINGKYYVSILYEIPDILPKLSKSIVGIDLGVKSLITLSDAKVYENNKYIEKYEKRIKRLQRSLARKEKKSKNYYKCKQKLSILYSKLKNARNYYIHTPLHQIM